MKKFYLLPSLLMLVLSISFLQAAEPVVTSTESGSVSEDHYAASIHGIAGMNQLMLLPASASAVRVSERIPATVQLEANPEGYLKKSEMLNLYQKGIDDARADYDGHKKAGMATLVSSSLILPMGIISAADQSSPGYRDKHFNAMDSELKSNPAYLQGFQEEALKKRKKSVRKNLIIGTAIQAAIITGIGSLFIHSGNTPVRIGMSGF